eukprot:maker-scaffold1299_size49759-snap-gene-0.14 protein:Tk03391 transcript:maker-scaffold1299_size49759-snap-gene-0.14-mRNA-1 annotation:"hypothetical protein"
MLSRNTLEVLTLAFLVTNLLAAADYDCSDGAYKGKCYDCFYNTEMCHRAGPSVIYRNGIIYTVDKAGDANWNTTPKEAMVVKNGKIAYVGSTSEAMGFNVPGTTRVVDLARKTVLPGFHDTHMHPLESRHKAAGTCMLTKDTKPEDQLQVFRDHCFDNQKDHIQLWAEYKLLRNRSTNAIRRDRRRHVQDIAEQHPKDTRMLWDLTAASHLDEFTRMPWAWNLRTEDKDEGEEVSQHRAEVCEVADTLAEHQE